jgi:hypothetical protein
VRVHKRDGKLAFSLSKHYANGLIQVCSFSYECSEFMFEH